METEQIGHWAHGIGTQRKELYRISETESLVHIAYKIQMQTE